MTTIERLATGMTVQVLEEGGVVDTAIITAYEDGEKVEIRSITACPGETILFGFTGDSPRTEGWRKLFKDPMDPDGKLCFSQRSPTFTFEVVPT